MRTIGTTPSVIAAQSATISAQMLQSTDAVVALSMGITGRKALGYPHTVISVDVSYDGWQNFVTFSGEIAAGVSSDMVKGQPNTTVGLSFPLDPEQGQARQVRANISCGLAMVLGATLSAGTPVQAGTAKL